jgi:hypothetical protein
VRRDDDLTTFMCRVSKNSGALTYRNPKATRSVVELHYVLIVPINFKNFANLISTSDMLQPKEVNWLTCSSVSKKF